MVLRLAGVRAKFGPMTRSRRISLALAAVLLTAGCAPELQIDIDQVEGHDFSSAHSYAWVTDDPVMIKAGGGNEAIRTDRNEARIRQAVELALGDKGYAMVSREEADLLIAFSLGADMHYRIQGGQTGGATYDLLASGPSVKQTKGTVTVYVFDRATATKVWQGSVSKWVRQEGETDETLQKGARALFERFPDAAASAASP